MKAIVNREAPERYKSELPFGSGRKIAERAGVSPNSVTAFLKGRNKSYRIEKVVLEYIAELRAERKQLMKKAGLKQ